MKLDHDNPEIHDDEKFARLLQLLHTRLIADQEGERLRLAAYLNDTAVQILLALHIRLSMHVNEPPQSAQSQWAEMLDMIIELAGGLALTAKQLRPLELDTLGLHEVLQQACQELTELSVYYEGIELPRLPEAMTLCFYRLAQEALANVLRHAQATKVWVKLQADRGFISLTVKDDGIGFGQHSQIDHPVDAPGLGLFNLMVRFQQLNGRLTIHSIPGQGTVVTAVLPIPHN
jgi:signal transduction histidine kinase